MRTESRSAVHWSVMHGVPRALLASSARRGDVQARLVVAAASAESASLWELVEEIRSLGPLPKGRFAFITARHDVVREVLCSNDFRAARAQLTETFLGRIARRTSSGVIHPVEPPSLLVTDPPDHTRYRKLVTGVFTVRAVERFRERVRQIADELVDRMDPQSPVDLVPAYCAVLPVTVITEILGVPERDRSRILRLGAGAAGSLDLGLTWRQSRRVESALADFDDWLGEHLAGLRRQPGDDLMSRLVHARDEEGALTDLELKSTAGLVLAAGFETTVNLLGNGVALLREHPDQLARLRQTPSLWPNAVDEILRLDPPVLLTGRTAARDLSVAGVRVPAGALVTTLLGGANRDPAVFAEPQRFDVGRPNARDHLSFSAGRHYCLGASLARMEGEVGLRTLFDRFPDLTLMPGSRRRATRVLRGYDALPARLTG